MNYTQAYAALFSFIDVVSLIGCLELQQRRLLSGIRARPGE